MSYVPLHRRTWSEGATPVWLAKVQSSTTRLTPKRIWAVPVAFTCFMILFIIHFARPPVLYNLLPPTHYQSILENAIERSFPSHLRPDLQQALGSRAFRTSEGIPNRLYQTDHFPPSPHEAKTWINHGFERVFMDDTEAAAWVEANFGESNVARVYKELPLPILKADMFRYLVLLAEGGVYSDVDTRALMPMSQWGKGAVPWPFSTSPTYPVRMIVGIEGDLHVWRDKTTFVEGIGITQTGRHRPLQFAQWTIASQSAHPILVDAVRRIMDTAALATAWNITHTRHIEAFQAAEWWHRAHKLQTQRKPWEADTKGEKLSVQEWTGPAVFTDSVLSYLLAVGGVRMQDLYDLDHPIQVGDVVILPVDGYNPLHKSLPNPLARSIHLFRGSWKDHWRAPNFDIS